MPLSSELSGAFFSAFSGTLERKGKEYFISACFIFVLIYSIFANPNPFSQLRGCDNRNELRLDSN